MANYSCKKFSTTTYPLATIRPLQTDGQTTTMPIARPSLKYSTVGKSKLLPLGSEVRL